MVCCQVSVVSSSRTIAQKEHFHIHMVRELGQGHRACHPFVPQHRAEVARVHGRHCPCRRPHRAQPSQRRPTRARTLSKIGVWWWWWSCKTRGTRTPALAQDVSGAATPATADGQGEGQPNAPKKDNTEQVRLDRGGAARGGHSQSDTSSRSGL